MLSADQHDISQSGQRAAAGPAGVDELVERIERLTASGKPADLEKATVLLRQLSESCESVLSLEAIRSQAKQLSSSLGWPDIYVREAVGGEKLTGIVTSPSRARTMPVVEGRLVAELEAPGWLWGKARWDVLTFENLDVVNGAVSGMASFRDRKQKKYPIVDNEIITKIDGRPVLDTSSCRISNGRINAAVAFRQEGGRSGEVIERYSPVLDGRIIEQIEGFKIYDAGEVENSNGLLNGWVSLDMSAAMAMPVIDGRLILEIDGRTITNAANIRNVNGALNGRVQLDGKIWLPVVGGKLVPEIQGFEIKGCSNIAVIEGNLYGLVTLADSGHWHAVVGGKLIRDIDGLEIEAAMRVEPSRFGWHGSLYMCDGRTLPVCRGQLIQEIEGRRIMRSERLHFLLGSMSGVLRTARGTELRMLMDEIQDESEARDS